MAEYDTIITTDRVRRRYGLSLSGAWNRSSLPLSRECLEHSARQIAGPRCLVDFGFEWRDDVSIGDFEREFGRKAAQHWGFRLKPTTVSSFYQDLKQKFTGPIRHQLGLSDHYHPGSTAVDFGHVHLAVRR